MTYYCELLSQREYQNIEGSTGGNGQPYSYLPWENPPEKSSPLFQ